MSSDYENREYLSVGEVATHTGLSVREIHRKIKSGDMEAFKSGGGQYRFRLDKITSFRKNSSPANGKKTKQNDTTIHTPCTTQTLITGDARNMHTIEDGCVHLAITSPPYFNAKMYTENKKGDLGNIHDLDEWFSEIGKVWSEVYRVLAPGRKFFLNIMNLPIRENKSFRTLNLMGKTIDLCEQCGFIFKRDIVWHKTNGVRAHFGTYPYPGSILLNNMHEFILEFNKPSKSPANKYTHVTESQRSSSKLDKDFWLSLKNSDVWLIHPEKSGGGREHSAPFPLELPSRLIRAYSFVGETILDPFAGSGTTLVSAAKLKRHGIGVEINADFCQLATKRLQEILT